MVKIFFYSYIVIVASNICFSSQSLNNFFLVGALLFYLLTLHNVTQLMFIKIVYLLNKNNKHEYF